MISLSILVLNSPKFKEGLKEAIETGISIDYQFDGESENPVMEFDSEQAMTAVVYFLETHINHPTP